MTSGNSKGFTLVELMIVVAIIGIVAATALPGLLRARMAANEASGIASMRAIHSAQSTYFSACSNSRGYASSLDDLSVPAVPGEPPFISPNLAANGVLKSGYIVNVGGNGNPVDVSQLAACNGTTPDTGFWAEAHPQTLGLTGQRSFGVDQRGIIYFDMAGTTFTEAAIAASTNFIH